MSIDVQDGAFRKFIDIKESRDVIIHNGDVANAIYLKKSGGHARAQNGGKLVVDEKYFDHVVMIIKRISGIIAHDAQENFDKPVSGESG